jgi:hypothetical protein
MYCLVYTKQKGIKGGKQNTTNCCCYIFKLKLDPGTFEFVLEVFVFDVVCVVGDKRDDDNNLFNG